MVDIIQPAAAASASVPMPDAGGMLRRALEMRAAGDAQGAYRTLVGLAHAEPDNPAAWYHLGQALHETQKPAAAALAFARSDDLKPGICETLTNLGWTLHLSGQDIEADLQLTEACISFPDEALPHASHSQVLNLFGEHERAIVAARRAVSLDPAPIHRMALAFALLAAGRFREGLAEYEARFPYKIPEFLSYPYPLWRGEEVSRLFVQAEQGIGDALMMLRFIPEAARRCERVDLYVHRELLRLVAGLFADQPTIHVSPLPSPLPEADAFCPMLSLPVALGLFDSDLAEFATPAYIHRGISARPIDPQLAHLKVGIVWGGNPAHEGEHLRAVPLADLSRLALIPGVQLYSLQVGPQADDLGALGLFGIIRDLGPHLVDFAETASILGGLDLLICRDTAIAHLAGGMGHPCWLLVNQANAEWRWGQGGESPWYPSLRIFRRHLQDPSWTDLIVNDVAPELRALAERKGQ